MKNKSSLYNQSIICDLTLPWVPEAQNKDNILERYYESKFGLVSLRVGVERMNTKQTIEYIKQVKNHHRVVYLISGSHQLLVDQIDQHLKIFFESFGTKKNYNMVGINKVKFINSELKILEFDYLGNSKQDLPIWKYTKKIIFTNVSKDLRKIIDSSKLDKLEIKEKFQK